MSGATMRSDAADGDADARAEPSKPRRRPPLAPIAVRIVDAAKMLGISRSRFYELIEAGDIEIVKLGRATLVPVDSLHALIERLRAEQSGD